MGERVYLVDGSNAVRRADYDPRFPAMEAARVEAMLAELVELAAGCGGIRIEIFFDGPPRPMPPVAAPVSVRFPYRGDADEAILGTMRSLRASGRGAVVVTGDGALAEDARAEGARVMGIGELLARLRSGRA